ncbi:hypothetical protein LIA77_03643 [Sarocladium implicatum]|nr:hypothetical protein LIA77_03643 [Sarocladium implicatum]
MIVEIGSCHADWQPNTSKSVLSSQNSTTRPSTSLIAISTHLCETANVGGSVPRREHGHSTSGGDGGSLG